MGGKMGAQEVEQDAAGKKDGSLTPPPPGHMSWRLVKIFVGENIIFSQIEIQLTKVKSFSTTWP